MSSVYITFDSYYGVDEYNSFKTAARNNGIEYEEFLRIRPPYKRFLKIKDKKDLPSFINYDFATSSDKRWLVSTVKAVQPNEEYLLRRRDGKDISYWNYILPKPLLDATKEKYMMVFRASSTAEIRTISKQLGDHKIYKWGKSKLKKYNIYYTFTPYIRGLVYASNQLMEFGEESKSSVAQVRESKIPDVKGDIEYYLNHFVLIKEKLEDKTLEAEYWENGNIHPLKRETFIV